MAQRRLSQKHSVVIARLRSHTMVPATEVSATETSATRVALHHDAWLATGVAP